MAVTIRTEVEDIKAIIDTQLTDVDIQQFMNTAAVLIDAAGLNVSGYAEQTLTEIEKYLTAHLISITKERQALKEDAGTAAVTYTGKYEMDLLSTSYGQMATILDVNGLLKKAGKKSVEILAINQVDNTHNYIGDE